MDEQESTPVKTIFKPLPPGMIAVPNLLDLLTDAERQALSDEGWELVEARPDVQPDSRSGYTLIFQQMQE